MAVVCLLAGASVYERQAKDMRWLSRRLVEKRTLIERQTGQLSELVAGVDRVSITLEDVGERLRAVQAESGIGGESGDDAGDDVLAVEPVAAIGDYASEFRSEVEGALEHLAWMDRQAEAMGESAAMLASLLTARPAVAATQGGVPSLWPVAGRVTSTFGPRRSPHGRGSRLHPGLDIAAPHGSRIEAAGAGRVSFAGGSRGYGRLVVVDHGGDLKSVYAHLASVFVQRGQRVRRGDLLGTVGTTGNTTGPHLHYEVRFRGEAVDPMCYVGRGMPRMQTRFAIPG